MFNYHILSSRDVSCLSLISGTAVTLALIGGLERLIRLRRLARLRSSTEGGLPMSLASPIVPDTDSYDSLSGLISLHQSLVSRMERGVSSLPDSVRHQRRLTMASCFDRLHLNAPKSESTLKYLDMYLVGEASYTIPRESVLENLRTYAAVGGEEATAVKAELAGVLLFQLLLDLHHAQIEVIPLRSREAADEIFEDGLDCELLDFLKDFEDHFDFFETFIEKLQQEIRTRNRANMSQLFRYMWASSPFKVACVGVSLIFVYGSSKLVLAGNHLRRRIDNLVFSDVPADLQALPADVHYESRALCAEHVLLLTLIGFEILRMTCNTILDNASREFLMASTAHHRERIKMDVYCSLMKAPLSFYDLYSYDSIEEMVMFVNDLEGVDVHVQNFLMNTFKVGIECSAKLATINAEADAGGTLLLAFLIVAISSPVEWVLNKIVASQQALSHVEDLEELENTTSADSTKDLCSKVLLRGLEIVENIHTLRPLGGDVRLMQWWVDFLEHLTDYRDFGGAVPQRRRERSANRASRLRLAWEEFIRAFDILVRRISLRVVRTSVVWIGPLASSTNRMFKTMLPVFIVGILRASQRGGRDVPSILLSPTFIQEVISSVEGVIDAAKGGRDLWELMQLNAHKAHILHCVRSGWHLERESSQFQEDFTHRLIQPVELQLRNISFAYPSRPDRIVLQNLNFTIPLPPGKIIAITGPNGCGKSTLLALMLRLYDPTVSASHVEGVVSPRIVLKAEDYRPSSGMGIAAGVMEKLSGAVSMRLHRSFRLHPVQQDVDEGAVVEHQIHTQGAAKDFDFSQFSTAIAQSVFTFAPQTPVIFAGTVAQNISLDAQISLNDSERLERIKLVAHHAQCDAFVQTLPEMYFTQLAPMGSSASGDRVAVKLSGGQAQRICLARALYRSSQVLILDEPTSSLDVAARAEVMDGLRSLISKNDLSLELQEFGRDVLQGRSVHGSNVRTVVCVTHDDEVLRAADIVVHMPKTA